MKLNDQQLERLEKERNIWLATVRPGNGRPHMVPVWFAWHNEQVFICIQPGSVKAKNMAANPQVALSLEDGSNVVICEGETAVISTPYPEPVIAIFKKKYDWDITTDEDYGLLLAIEPKKWMTWGETGE